MKLEDLFQFAFLPQFRANTSPFECTPAAFSALLPPNAHVAFTRSLPANSTFEVPASDIAYPTSPQNLRALCAVQINVTSSPKSAYSFGLFLPTQPEEWNHRFLAVGNGGFSGGINWLDMAAGLGYGFATMSTDTGHNSTFSVEWAFENEERRKDFGWRAMHGSVELAKTLVQAFYGGEKAEWNYYSGCSTGGRQGLKALQMFPEDFDGVLAGAPAWWTTRLQPWTIKLGAYNLPRTAEWHIPAELFPVIGKEVLRQCDPQDGVIDGIIMDPPRCDFFAEALLRKGPAEKEKTCLTAPQIDTLEKIYTDYVETNQTFIFPHLPLGSEAEWPVLLGNDKPNPLGYEYPQYMLDLGPDWKWEDYDHSIVQLADRTDPGNCNADDFDLSPFQRRGGKVMMYHGYADGLIPAGSSTLFYKKVLKSLVPKGVEVDTFFRHFLVPGMQHCARTPPDVDAPWYFAGANQAGVLSPPGAVHGVPGFEDAEHDILRALMSWVEDGRAPERFVATKWRDDGTRGEVLRQRPVCAYPRRAVHDGVGDVDKAGSWRCVGFV